MKKALLLLPVMALVLLFTATTVLASGVEITGIGARAHALGGNYRAIANDWSAMYWNPAGLAFTEKFAIGASFEIVMPKATYTVGNSLYGQQNGANYPFSAVYRTDRTNEPQTFYVPALGVSLNTGKLAFGVGVWAPFGLGSKWDLLRTGDNNFGNVPGKLYDTYSRQYPNIEYESSLQVIDIHPTVSFKITEKLSIGAGASILLNDIAIRKPVYIQNPYLYNPVLAPQLDMIAFAAGLTPVLAGMRSSPFDHLLTQVEVKGSGTGFGANFGVMFKPTENLSIGATVQYYLDQQLDGTFQNTIYFADASLYNNVARTLTDSVFTKALQAGLITADQFFVLSQYYSGQVIDEGLQDVKTALPLPAKVGLGVAYSGLKNLLISADVAYTQWSAWDKIIIENLSGVPVAEMVQNWQNTLRIGVGLEYSVGDAKIRGGFYSEPPAVVDETLTVAIPDINRRNVFSFGLQVPIGPVSFALNYEKLFFAEKTVDTWVYDKLTSAQNLAGTYTVNANNLMIGMNYHF